MRTIFCFDAHRLPLWCAPLEKAVADRFSSALQGVNELAARSTRSVPCKNEISRLP